MGAAYNKHSDIVATLAMSTAGDTGTTVGVTYGSPVTLNFDSIQVNDSVGTVNNSGGQDAVALMRGTQREWSVDIETKWGQQFFRPALLKQAQLVITHGTGTDTFNGIITAAPATYNDDSTVRITLSAYGVAPVYA